MESTWVRSVYLYLMCAVAVLLVAGGAVMGVVAVTHVIAPGLGHRDNLDRVGVGVANVADDVIDIVRGQTGEDRSDIEDYCEEWADDDEFDDCVAEMSGDDEMQAVTEGIATVKDEIEGQIRDTALARLIRAVLLIVVGVLLWRFHAPRTELYRHGLRPSTPVPATPTVATSAPVPGAVPAPLVPPAPPAPGSADDSSGEW